MLKLRDTRYNDVRLIFKEDGHKYTDTLGNEYLSTTTFYMNTKQSLIKLFGFVRKLKNLVLVKRNLQLNGTLLEMKPVIEEVKLIMVLKME